MDEQPHKTLDYSSLPSAKPRPRSKKPQLVLLGWVLVVGPAMVGVVVGIVVTLSNIIAPGKSYRLGDSKVTPQSQGLGMEWFELVMCLLVGTFLSAIIWRAVVTARKMRRQ